MYGIGRDSTGIIIVGVCAFRDDRVWLYVNDGIFVWTRRIIVMEYQSSLECNEYHNLTSNVNFETKKPSKKPRGHGRLYHGAKGRL